MKQIDRTYSSRLRKCVAYIREHGLDVYDNDKPYSIVKFFFHKKEDHDKAIKELYDNYPEFFL